MYVNARLTALANKRVELELLDIELYVTRRDRTLVIQQLAHLDAEIEVSKSYLNSELQAQLDTTLRSTLKALEDIDEDGLFGDH